jgi:protein phosphatase
LLFFALFIDSGLSKDELILFDYNNSNGETSCSIINTVGARPGPRYGHSMVFNKPYLIVFGGHTGDEALNDTWVISLDQRNFIWEKIPSPDSKIFPPRVYHSAALCLHGNSSGMMVIFGGRNSQSEIVESAWGLRRHRNEKWDWVRSRNNFSLKNIIFSIFISCQLQIKISHLTQCQATRLADISFKKTYLI